MYYRATARVLGLPKQSYTVMLKVVCLLFLFFLSFRKGFAFLPTGVVIHHHFLTHIGNICSNSHAVASRPQLVLKLVYWPLYCLSTETFEDQQA